MRTLKHILLGLAVISTPFFILYQFNASQNAVALQTEKLNEVSRKLYAYEKDTVSSVFLTHVQQFYRDKFEVQEMQWSTQKNLYQDQLAYREEKIKDLTSQLKLKAELELIKADLKAIIRDLQNTPAPDLSETERLLNDIKDLLKQDSGSQPQPFDQLMNTMENNGITIKSKRPRKLPRSVPLIMGSTSQDTITNYYNQSYFRKKVGRNK